MEKQKTEYKSDDRVKRLDRPGCLGTVLTLREEVVGSSGEAALRSVMVKIQWDNGTVSYFQPEAIELVK